MTIVVSSEKDTSQRLMGVSTLLLSLLLISGHRCISSSNGILQEGGEDPLTGFRIVGPEDGAVETLPIQIRLEINVSRVNEFEAYYADAYLCVELNGLWKKCMVPDGPPIIFSVLPEGNYTATAYINDKHGLIRNHESKGPTFTLLSFTKYSLHYEMLARRSREEQQFPEEMDLLHWAEHTDIKDREEDNVVLPRTHVSLTTSPVLVIGVKTAVVTSFPRRQAIRDTWASPTTLPQDVKVLFLGCEPNMTIIEDDHDRRRVLRAVAKERAAFQDLLTEELECTDSYRSLSDKVKSFMHLAAAEFPHTKFVMLADDDVYVKVGELAESLRNADTPKLYFGEVWAVKFAHKQKPIRDPESQYYLPDDQYPMRSLLPYASGPHYVVSMDGVRFIAKNYWNLRTLNGLEDVSSGFWLRSMNMHAQHTAQFSSIRASRVCDDYLVSFADLSPLGIRSIHANVVNNRSFCHGFNSGTWHRDLNSISSLEEMLLQPSQEAAQLVPLQLETHIDNLDANQVTVVASTPSNAGMKLYFTPPVESVDNFIQRLCVQVYNHFPASTSSSCEASTSSLRHELQLDATSLERQLSVGSSHVLV